MSLFSLFAYCVIMPNMKAPLNYKLCQTNASFNSDLYYTDTTGSTMQDAQRWAVNSAAHGSGLIAGFQQNGRGRGANRKWESDPGKSLLATFVFQSELIPIEPSLFPLFVGVATVSFCRNKLGIPVGLCWPNDILYKGKKLAGVLCNLNNGIFHLGIGMNLNQSEFSDDYRRPPVSLFQIKGREFDPVEVANDFLDSFFNSITMDLMLGKKWRTLLDQYLLGVGRTVHFLSGEADQPKGIIGTFLGIDENGLVQIQTEDKKVHSFATGEFAPYQCKKNG